MSYRALLRNRPFASLWFGATVSAMGDALTWVALVWLVLETSGSAEVLGGFVVAATAPVIVGGPVMGMLLDRLDRRRVLISVNLVLAMAVSSIPLASMAGALRTWHLYGVAGVYGLLKMANWAGVPSLMPSLVPEEGLNTANAMESVSFGVADVGGPAMAGALIASVGARNVMLVDALTYLVFVVVLVRLPANVDRDVGTSARLDLRPALASILRQPAVLATTLMFMAFNVGEGMLLVLLPVFARRELSGDATTYGLLLSAFALSATGGSVVVGALRWRWTLGRSIAATQTAAGLAFLGLAFAPGRLGAMGVLVVAGALTSPMTIWAQTIRMRVIPAELRGRVFGVLRTLMQSTPPIGGAMAGVMLAGAGLGPTVIAIVAVMAVPGIVGLVSPALDDRFTRTPTDRASPLGGVPDVGTG